MKKNILMGMMVVLTVIMMASAAQAGPGYGRGKGCGVGYGIPPLLNLTPEKITKNQTIQQATFKDITPLQQGLLSKRVELRATWISQNPHYNKISVLQKENLNLKGKIQEKNTNARFEIRKVLTPEQQARLSTYSYGRGYGKGRMTGLMGGW